MSFAFASQINFETFEKLHTYSATFCFEDAKDIGNQMNGFALAS